jgi:hypothetical protein
MKKIEKRLTVIGNSGKVSIRKSLVVKLPCTELPEVLIGKNGRIIPFPVKSESMGTAANGPG